MRKLIEFDEDTFDKADEAFADLLKKHGIPVDLKDALRKSAALDQPAKSGARSKPAGRRKER